MSNVPVLPLCQDMPDAYNGGCVDYQMRMTLTSVALFVIIMFVDLRWKLPFLFFLVYAAGRLVTALSSTIEVQIFIAGPFLCVAYGWGHTCYSSKPLRDVAMLLAFVWLWSLSVYCFEGWFVWFFTIKHTHRFHDVCQLMPATVALTSTWIATFRHGVWGWFAGLFFGIVDGPTITLFGGPGRHYAALSSPYLGGPALFYADLMVTIPLIFAGMLTESMRPTAKGKWQSKYSDSREGWELMRAESTDSEEDESTDSERDDSEADEPCARRKHGS